MGYRRDIGYQTFLYSNVAEVRRVFMFLIEQLPKESGDTATDELPFDRVTELEARILDTMRQQLQSSWSQRGALDLRQRGTLRGPRRLPFVTQSDVTAGKGRVQCVRYQSLPRAVENLYHSLFSTHQRSKSTGCVEVAFGRRISMRWTGEYRCRIRPPPIP